MATEQDRQAERDRMGNDPFTADAAGDLEGQEPKDESPVESPYESEGSEDDDQER